MNAQQTGFAALAALCLGAVAMGASPIFVRLADVGPFASAFWRVALALPALWVWMAWERHHAEAPPPPRRVWFGLVLTGALFSGDLFFWHLAILNTSVANATLLAVMTPIPVAIGAFVFLREPLTPRIAAGVALGFCGAAMLLGASFRFDPARLAGDGFALVTACFFGSYFVAMKSLRRELGTGAALYYSTWITAIILCVIALSLEDRLMPLGAEGWMTLVALALVSQVAGQGLLAFALGHLAATFSSLVIFLEAVAAALLGWFVLGEALTPLQGLGGLVIITGITAARPRQNEKPETKS